MPQAFRNSPTKAIDGESSGMTEGEECNKRKFGMTIRPHISPENLPIM